MKILWVLTVYLISAAPFLVLAEGLVPCGSSGQESCETCHFYQLVENVFNWIFGVAAIVAAIIILVGGMRLVTSGGNQAAKRDARKIIGTAVIGFIMIGASWVLIELLIATLYGQADAGNIWETIQCVD